MTNPLIKLIEIIKTGSPDQVKIAQKQVKKYCDGFSYDDRDEREHKFSDFFKELDIFDQIKDNDHKAYLINSFKWAIMATDDNYFEKWAEFFIDQIQNPSGKVRQAILNAVDWLIIGITFDIKWIPKHKITFEQEEQIKKNKKRFGDFVFRIEQLLDKYHEPKFNRYKYVDSLPIGIYKSLQKLLKEHLLRSEHYKKEYKKYLKNRPTLSSDNIYMSQDDFFSTRQETERDLINLLKRHKSEFDLDYIKNIIYRSEDQDDLTKIIAIFDRGEPEELQNILDLITDAWNYFPHKKLNGKCPMEIVYSNHKS